MGYKYTHRGHSISVLQSIILEELFATHCFLNSGPLFCEISIPDRYAALDMIYYS